MNSSHCLAIPELLRNIAELVRENGDLYALATVSRSFSTHALDCMWEVIIGFHAFVSALPEGIVTMDIQKFHILVSLVVTESAVYRY